MTHGNTEGAIRLGGSLYVKLSELGCLFCVLTSRLVLMYCVPGLPCQQCSLDRGVDWLTNGSTPIFLSLVLMEDHALGCHVTDGHGPILFYYDCLVTSVLAILPDVFLFQK